MVNYKLFSLVFALLLLLPLCSAIIEDSSMTIYAVTTEGKGLVAYLNLGIKEGSGRAWVDVEPLVGTSTQSTAKAAVIVAKDFYRDVDEYDYFFDINSNASVVEGPSAGAAMALLLISMLKDKQLPYHVSITGTITEEGFVGPVGGVYEKAKEASEQGMKLFMIPKGEAKQTIREGGEIKSINLIEYAPNNLGLKVVEVANIDDVLQYAFSDIDTIDVNADVTVLPDFIPDAIDYPDYLSTMKELTNKYIIDAKAEQEEAKNAISTTLIGDSSLVSSLLEVINNNEESLKLAGVLAEQNYFYSAANYAFVSKVNAMFVKDISNNPSILESDSTAFDLKLLSLKRDITNMKETISNKVFVDYLEWQVAALQRLSWAEYNYNMIENSNQVVIITYGNGSTVQEDTIEKIQDYEFAVAWVSASRDFYDIAKSSGKEVDIKPRNLNDLAPVIEEYIIAIEDVTAIMELDEDILRRLNSAKKSLEDKEYLPALYDAASAYALAEALVVSDGLSAPELEDLLQESISQVSPKLDDSDKTYLWSKLYFDHSRYFLEAAGFYAEHGLGSRHKASLADGISLVFLSSELTDATDLIRESVRKEIERSGATPVDPGNNPGLSDNLGKVFAIFGFVILLLVVIIVVLIVVINSLIKMRNKYNLGMQIRSLRDLEEDIYDSHEKGNISDGEFAANIASLTDEITHLDDMRKEKADHIMNVDKLKCAVHMIDHQMSDLTKLQANGVLTEKEFISKAGSLKRQLVSIKSSIKRETEKLRIGESIIKRTIERVSKVKKESKKNIKSAKKKKVVRKKTKSK